MFCTHCGFKNSDGFNFCASCGSKNFKNSEENNFESSLKERSSNIKSEELIEISTTIKIYLEGEDSPELSKLICEAIDVKDFYKVIFNTYATSDFFIVMPISKDKGNIALFGLLLGGGGLAAGAMAALGVLAKKLELKQSEAILSQDNPLFGSLLFKSKDLLLQIKETGSTSTDLMDIFAKETWVQISGLGMYKNKEYKVAVQFGFRGQASNPKKKKIEVIDKLIKALEIPAPVIYVGNNPPF